MKLTKISLAAVVALGAFSTTAMAADLSEVIKGVDASGTIRYRFTNVDTENVGNVKDADQSVGSHDWRGLITLKTPMVDQFQGVVGLRYDDGETTGATANTTQLGKTDMTGSTNSYEGAFAVHHVYGVFAVPNTKTSIMFGKQPLPTPVTNPEDDRGTGVLAMSTDISAVTLAAGAFDEWYADSTMTALASNQVGMRKPLYTAAAIMTPIAGFSAQAWYFQITDISKSLIFVEGAYAYEFSKGKEIGLKGQYFNHKLDTSATAKGSKILTPGQLVGQKEDNPTLYTAQLSGKFDIVSASLGYLASGNDGSWVSLDSTGGVAVAGEDWYDFSAGGTGATANPNGKNKLTAWYVTAGVDVTAKVNVAADYAAAEFKQNAGTAGATDTKLKRTELVPRVSYVATKNLKLSSWYSMIVNDPDTANAENENINKLRIQAVYSF